MEDLLKHLNTALPNLGMDWLATVTGLTGHYLLGNKNKFGFISLMIASLSWITFAILTGSTAIILGSSIYLFLHLRSFYIWKKSEIT